MNIVHPRAGHQLESPAGQALAEARSGDRRRRLGGAPHLAILATCWVALLIVCTGFFRSRTRRSIFRMLAGACCIQA